MDCGEPEGLAIAEQLGPQVDVVDARVQSESLREEMRCRIEDGDTTELEGIAKHPARHA